MFYGTYKLMMDRFPAVTSRKKPGTAKQAFTEIAGRRRACRELLAKSDRMLADMGFSRELLDQGVEAWPWLAAPDTTVKSAVTAPVVTLTANRSDVAEEQYPVMVEQRHAA